MYSTDRAKALEYTLSCLNDMELYDQCQKTLVVDGKIDHIPKDWDVIQVPRLYNKFCWGRMWDAGVMTAQYDKIVYLDADRLLPQSYLQLVDKHIGDNTFLYTSQHFMMLQELDLLLCKDLLKRNLEGILVDESLVGLLRYDKRRGEPYHGPGKNVMSGSVAFTKKTYLKLGGVDHWYCGHGAFADTDFHLSAATQGAHFLDLLIPELHFHHSKLNNNSIISEDNLKQMGLDNFIYYCRKWKLPMTLAQNLALNCGIRRPDRYIATKLRELH